MKTDTAPLQTIERPASITELRQQLPSSIFQQEVQDGVYKFTKASQVLRCAAYVVFDEVAEKGFNYFGCNLIDLACYNQPDDILDETAMSYFRLFSPDPHLGRTVQWFGLDHEQRMLSLLMAADMAESEGQ